jgi:hypothetical protein
VHPKISHQLSSSHKCSSELSCSSHQSPVPNQYHCTTHQSALLFSVALTKLGPRTSPFPVSGSHPQRGSFFHSSDLIPSPFSFMALDLRVPMSRLPSSLMLGEGTGSEATDKPLPSRCRSTTSSALCFADFFLMLSFSPAASLQRTCLS